MRFTRMLVGSACARALFALVTILLTSQAGQEAKPESKKPSDERTRGLSAEPKPPEPKPGEPKPAEPRSFRDIAPAAGGAAPQRLGAPAGTIGSNIGNPRKRVAIINFDYASVQGGVQALFGSNQDVGQGIADLLVDKLVADGTYTVVERKAIDQILAEQSLSNSDRLDSNTAAKIGRVLGVDAVIVGSITQFGRDDRKTGIGGGALGGRFGIGGAAQSKSKAVVAVTARMIDTSTGEIVASTTARGESTRAGATLLGAGGTSAASGTTRTTGSGAIDMKSANFSNTILGEAVTSAVQKLGTELDARANALAVRGRQLEGEAARADADRSRSAPPNQQTQIEGLVADAAPDGTLVINLGSRAGVKVGDSLQIARQGRAISDPATGKVLRRLQEKVGELTIVEVDENSAVGKFTGPQSPKVGDTVSHPK